MPLCRGFGVRPARRLPIMTCTTWSGRATSSPARTGARHTSRCPRSAGSSGCPGASHPGALPRRLRVRVRGGALRPRRARRARLGAARRDRAGAVLRPHDARIGARVGDELLELTRAAARGRGSGRGASSATRRSARARRIPSAFSLLAATGPHVAVAVRCPACTRTSINLVSRPHLDVPFHNDRQIGIVEHVFAEDRDVDASTRSPRSCSPAASTPAGSSWTSFRARGGESRTQAKSGGWDVRALAWGERASRSRCRRIRAVARHPDQRGHDGRLLGRARADRGRGARSRARARNGQHDAGHPSGVLAGAIPDRVPARPRRRRMDRGRPSAARRTGSPDTCRTGPATCRSTAS